MFEPGLQKQVERRLAMELFDGERCVDHVVRQIARDDAHLHAEAAYLAGSD